MKTRRSIRNLVAQRVTPSSRKAQRRVRLAMETLEGRWLLSTFTVTNLIDDGSVGSLRWAVNEVNQTAGANTINFDSTVFNTAKTITLTGSPLELSNAGGTETITGPAAGVTISGGGLSRVFKVDNLVAASISGMTISDGYANGSGDGDPAGYGGGLANNGGTLTLTDCTVSGNSAFGAGGLLSYGGALSLTNCTVSGNTARVCGGLLTEDSATTVTNCTVSSNSAEFLGGMYSFGTAALTNTIVAGNGGGDFSGSYSGTNNLIGGNPLLAPLGNYGGPTQAMALLPGSPAIDAGTTGPGIPSTDQRGLGRVGPVDIGAFESQGFTLTLVAGSSGQTAPIGAPFSNPLGVIVAANNPIEPVDGGAVSFVANPVHGAMAILSAPSAAIADGRAVDVAGPNNADGSYTVVASATDSSPVTIALSNTGPMFPGLAVNTTSDALFPGAGLLSLREAIDNANLDSVGISTITFDIAEGAQTIHVGSGGYGPLPVITEPVILDGTTQPGLARCPLIELDGTDAGALANGLVITPGGSTVKGLVINRFQGNGIVLQSGGGNLIEGDYLGTNVSGTDALGNNTGVSIFNSPNNTVGGTVPGSLNIISGNLLDGVRITGPSATGNVVLGNRIGTDVTGTNALGNGRDGVLIFQSGGGNTIGGAAPGARNIISGNGSFGVSANGSYGVVLEYETGVSDVVVGNYIGTDITGTHSLGNASGGVGAAGNVGARIGGFGPGEGNVISGNAIGIDLQGDTNDVVAGNDIGTDASGDNALGNSTAGVVLEGGASNNLIGGTEDGSGNVISGNGVAGIFLRGLASGNAIAGNRIGTNAVGTPDLPNGQVGVGIYQVDVGISGVYPTRGNLIGAVLNADGTLHPAGNLIAGNNGPGVWVEAGGQTVDFNTITDNRGAGVAVSDLLTSQGAPPQSGYLPGDVAPDFTLEDQNGNDVSLSDFAGKFVLLDFCARWCIPCHEQSQQTAEVIERLQDEHIPFEYVQVLVEGFTPGVPATLADAQAWAQQFHLSSPVVFGSKAEGLLNDWGGGFFPTDILLTPDQTTYFEFTTDGQADIASFVSAEAAGTFTAPGNNDSTILSNSIWGNGGLGIDLGNDGVTTNTPGTHTSGPNLLQNSPVLTSVTTAAGGNKTVSGYLDSTPNSTFLVQLYANGASGFGQGQNYLGQTLVTTDSTGQASYSFTYTPQPGVPFLSATATDDNGNTSEFSVVNGAGATIVGNTLYLVGGSTTSDQLSIQPIGSSTTGGTGIQVNGRLNGSKLNGRYTQDFATIYIIGSAGNDNLQAASSLTIPLVVSAGNGNDNIQVGAGNNTISLGNGNDNMAQTQHPCHQGQTGGPPFRRIGKRQRAGGQSEGRGRTDDLESGVIS
jgi:thiol-disulfide isomerase/thioredoxin